MRLQLHALAYNLGNVLRTLATPEPIKDWSLTSLKDKLIKIGAKVVSHGRYIAFQMAEVAIPDKCSRRFYGSSQNCGRSRYQRLHETSVVMCSRATDRRSVPECQGKRPIRLSDRRPGAWNGGSGRQRASLAVTPEKRKHSRRFGVHLGNIR